jgi:hypothetical protein
MPERADSKEGELSTSDLLGRENDWDQTAEETEAGQGPYEQLIESDQSDALRQRWEEIQTGFVDQPRRAVEQADGLVAEVLRHVAEGFSSERQRLEGQWGRGDDVSTEDLRQTLQRYRSFFNRLLSA